MKLLLKNYFATISFILGIFLFYNSFSYFQKFFTASFFLQPLGIRIESLIIFKIILLLYVVFLPIFYIFHKEKGKALIVVEYVSRMIRNLSFKGNPQEKTAVLAWLVKGFWAPLMIFWLSDHIVTMVNNTVATFGSWSLWKINVIGFFDNYFFWFCFSYIFFFDVFFFTLGYLIESPKLKNTIKSVEPTFLGWAVALACYPPFNGFITNGISYQGEVVIPGINWFSQDFPKFEDPTLHISLNMCLLLLLAIYSWASFSLGLKASNLTNRGIVTKGPYRFIRHPAYISKNLAWWIGGLPFIISSIQAHNWKMLSLILFSLVAWTFIYFLRAWTEERHLSKDPEYREYKKKVRYRFIPKIY